VRDIVVPEFVVGAVGKTLKADTPGELYAREAEYLYQTATRIGPGRYADLGVFLGLSTSALAQGIIDSGIEAKVDAVDTFEGHGLSQRNIDRLQTQEQVQLHLNKLGLQGPVTLHKGLFTEVAKKFEPETFDFIFIDGTHSYEAVSEDFVTWAPLLKVGGELAFHDSKVQTKGKQVWRLMDKMTLMGWRYITCQRTLTSWQKMPEAVWTL
jgi:predicted O-methyltransferase YrrM